MSVDENLQFIAEAELNTVFGRFQIRGFRFDGQDCVALHRPSALPKANALVRIQSSCLFGETFNSTDCDCRWQVHHSLQRISEAESGVFIYLYQEGRGIGILDKIRAYSVQQSEKCDTVEAFRKLGFETADLRTYDAAIAILQYYNINNFRLLTNNTNKAQSLIESGFHVDVHTLLPEDKDFKDISRRADDFSGLLSYLETKRSKLHQNIDEGLIGKLRDALKDEN